MTKKKEKEEDILEQKAIEEEVEEEIGVLEEQKIDAKIHEELRKTADRYLDGWKRTQADFENYKKDQAKRMEEFRKFSSLDMILQLIPVLDNFEKSLEHVPEKEKENAWAKGVNLILKQLKDVLKNYGVEEIETGVGDKFNPEIHEAIESDSNVTNEHPNVSNVIKKVVQKGYRIMDPARNASHSDAGGGKVIRAARVIVD